MNNVPSLADVLCGAAWMRRDEPFPHVVAETVFRESYYRELDDAFGRVLARGLGDGRDRLSRRIAGYDAYAMPLRPDERGPFRVFVSREWHDMLAAVLGVAGTGYVTCVLHHHATGSASGRVHNDLNPSWFAVYDSDTGIRLQRPDLVALTTGERLQPGIPTVELIRAATMLFYLRNPEWHDGDGGETGLYDASSDPVDDPLLAVPPRNNSLIAFPCTPYSYHSFLGNRRSPRNCLIMWLHQERATVAARWGLEAIVPWAAGSRG